MSRKETGRNYKAKGGGGMKPPSTRDLKLGDLNSLDTYLEEHHLQRKHTAKDGSCLFRAVAEQVFDTIEIVSCDILNRAWLHCCVFHLLLLCRCT